VNNDIKAKLQHLLSVVEGVTEPSDVDAACITLLRLAVTLESTKQTTAATASLKPKEKTWEVVLLCAGTPTADAYRAYRACIKNAFYYLTEEGVDTLDHKTPCPVFTSPLLDAVQAERHRLVSHGLSAFIREC